MNAKKIGILFCNLGTPSAPTPKAIRTFLRTFLSDKRVVNLPALPWKILLNLIILPLRSKRVAHAYQKIWLENGLSPLLHYTKKLQENIQEYWEQTHPNFPITTAIAMRYGHPSIHEAFTLFKKEGITEVLVFPLYPQYSSTTTASIIDAIFDYAKSYLDFPRITYVKSFHTHPDYIQALSQQLIQKQKEIKEALHFVISFHGLPESLIRGGDPYYQACLETFNAIISMSGLPELSFSLSFQSQFGYQKWLTPSTEQVLIELAQKGIEQVAVLCPGFSVDCLETLEEISIQIRDKFLESGGKSFYYIPALNDSEGQVKALSNIAWNYILRT